jgi:hypothetical protein
VDAGDALHGFAVAQRQAAPVHVLEHAHVRAAVVGDGDVFFGRQLARHGLAPQQFVAQLAVGVAVDAIELGDGGRDVGFGRRDEFQQRSA